MEGGREGGREIKSEATEGKGKLGGMERDGERNKCIPTVSRLNLSFSPHRNRNSNTHTHTHTSPHSTPLPAQGCHRQRAVVFPGNMEGHKSTVTAKDKE